jgi:putative chitinase
MIISIDLLKKVAGAPVNQKVVEGLSKHLPVVMEEYEINTNLRIAHFLAQLAHESDHFRTMREYASGSEYEGRKDLGNVRRGDGVRYKGRGPIQLTGRANYASYGEILGVDLINHPELAETAEIGVKIACEYWKQKNLNAWADRDDIRTITRRINGGYNGLASREAMYERAIKAITRRASAHEEKKEEPAKASEANNGSANNSNTTSSNTTTSRRPGDK